MEPYNPPTSAERGVCEARCTQDSDKNLYQDDLAGEAIDDLAGAAGEIDKQLLASDMG